MNIVPKNVLKYRSQKSMMKYEGAPSFTATRWTRPGTSARRFFFWTPRISIPVHWIFFLLRRTGRRFSDGFWAAGRPPTGRRATFEQLHRRWCPTWSRSAQIIHTHKHRRTTLQNSRQREKNPYPVVFFLLSISGYVPIIILDLRSRSWRTFRHGHNISEKTFSYKVWKNHQTLIKSSSLFVMRGSRMQPRQNKDNISSSALFGNSSAILDPTPSK